MSLLEIPPYVLAGDPPPSAGGWQRSFHTPSYYAPPAVEFPRELFVDALVEHARLLETHADAIRTARCGDDDDGPDYYEAVHLTCTILAIDGFAHEIHKWTPKEVSFVVQRCHGIVQRLMLECEEDTTHVVVVAREVASLHLLRRVEPKQGGDAERFEVVARDLVVEPWDQWHWRTRRAVYTWWRTPIGELVASRAVRKLLPRSWGQVVDVVVGLHEAEIRRGLARYARDNPTRRGLAIVMTGVGGDELRIVDRHEGASWTDGYPATLAAVAKPHRGFDPVIVDGYRIAGLRWLSRENARDEVVPPGMDEECPEDDDEDADG